MISPALYNDKTILAFKFVCGQVEHICRLCLSPTENNQVKLDSTVDLQQDYCNDTISYQSMLSNLDVQYEFAMPHILCANCAKLTLNCYLFQKIRQYSNDKWLRVLQLLKDSLLKMDTLPSKTKSTFVILNNSENLILKSTKSYKENPENTEVLRDLKRSCRKHVQDLEIYKNYICKNCNKYFDSQYFLNKHMRIQHQKINNYFSRYIFCHMCDKKYKKTSLFHNHIRMCHQVNKQEKYICNHCNKCYKRKDGLRSHIKINHGFGDVLECNWCYKRFDAVSRLRAHIVRHTKEKNFDCNVCERQFVTNAALVYHRRLHTGETPFSCDLCDKSFISASRRLEHKKRKHIGPKEECTLCNLKFVTSFQLRTHFYKHFNPASKHFITKECFKDLKNRGKIF